MWLLSLVKTFFIYIYTSYKNKNKLGLVISYFIKPIRKLDYLILNKFLVNELDNSFLGVHIFFN